MKRIGIIIIMALVFMGGCKTSEKAPTPKEHSNAIDTIAAPNPTAIVIETSALDNGNIQEENPPIEVPITTQTNSLGEVSMAYINTMEILSAMPETAKADQVLTAYGLEMENQIKSMLEEYQNKV